MKIILSDLFLFMRWRSRLMQNIIEKKKLRLERLKRVIQQQDNLLKMQERKARTRQLIEWGGLVAKAGLSHFKASTLLGALLDIKEQVDNNPMMIDHWSKHGGAIFNLNQNNKTAVVVSFIKTPESELILALRNAGMKWNNIRKEWQGYTDVVKIRQLLENIDAEVFEVNSSIPSKDAS